MNGRTLLFGILTGLFFTITSLTSYGSHSLGADLTYKCISVTGQDSFLVTLSFYRDCNGVSAPTFVSIPATSPGCGANTSVFLYPAPGSPVDITPLCPGWPSRC